MYPKQAISPLLESVVRDNLTYKFPIEFINKELTHMFLDREEFDYFSMQSYRNLKREYGNVIAHIFLMVLDVKLKLKERDIHSIPDEVYNEEIEAFIVSLENTYITRVPKDSPDGEMMSAMI